MSGVAGQLLGHVAAVGGHGVANSEGTKAELHQ